MRKKIEDEKGKHRKWNREKDEWRREKIKRLGGTGTNRCRRRFRTLQRRALKAAVELNAKYERKIDHLKKRESRPKGRFENKYPDSTSTEVGGE